VLSILAQPWPRTILVVGVIEGAAGFGVLAIWASHLHHAHAFSLSGAGAIVALFGAGGVLYMAIARHLIRRLRPARLAVMGVSLVFVASLVVGFTPYRWLVVPASLVAGFGFFSFHNVMQANAAQMAPTARGSAVSLFAASLFLGQSGGVMLAASLSERIGAGTVIALCGAALCTLGVWFGRALRARDAIQS
jgi:MFS transporter, YNFM family, putative membrane transport protein